MLQCKIYQKKAVSMCTISPSPMAAKEDISANYYNCSSFLYPNQEKCGWFKYVVTTKQEYKPQIDSKLFE